MMIIVIMVMIVVIIHMVPVALPVLNGAARHCYRCKDQQCDQPYYLRFHNISFKNRCN